MSALESYVAQTLWPIYAGSLVSSILYGVTCLQTFYYFRNYRDQWFITAAILSLWALDSVHQILASIITWNNILFGIHLPALHMFNWWNTRDFEDQYMVVAILLINMLVTELVNTFLAWRLWKLSGNKLLSRSIAVLLLGHLALNLPYIIHYAFRDAFEDVASVQRGFFELSTSYFVESIIGVALDCVLNALLAACLLYYLLTSRSGFRKSGNMITRLMTMTVSNGLLTSIFMIGQLATMIHVPFKSPNVYYFFMFVTGKMYINTLLTSLNMRETLRASLSGSGGESFPPHMHRNSRVVARIKPETTIEIMQSVSSSTQCHSNASQRKCRDELTISGKQCNPAL